MWLLDRLLRRIVRHGQLTLFTADGRRFDYGSAAPGQAHVAIRFTDRKVPFDIVANPRLGTGEAFMEGRLVIEQGDIMDLLALVRGNRPWEAGKSVLDSPSLAEAFGWLRRRIDHLNWASRARRNVAHHYDLDARLYDLFLDRDRQYSCAYFPDPGIELDEAQQLKKAHIAAKLALAPGQSVLDIGCGWGGMALYLNRKFDVDVLGITLSEEQLRVARARAAEAGVADRVRFELRDYRDVRGRFDRIVSVGMFEHVGPPFFETFFNRCRVLLADDGVMLLHTIGRMGGPAATDAFTRKYIFPGGYIPALSELVAASEKARLIASDVETLRLHYALTLDHWYARTLVRRAEIEALYDARFFRMWCFYLAGAAVAFRYGGLCNYQVQYVRDRHALPLTRDYMREDEKALTSNHDRGEKALRTA